jgi:hypothetical protein
MAAENIGDIFPTKIPGYQDAADIQEAFRLYHYGSASYDVTNTDVSDLPTPSIAKHLQNLTDAVEVAKRTGGDYLSVMPVTPSDGYIWVDSTSTSSGLPIYTTAVYSNTAPTEGISDGVIWVDKSESVPKAYIYDSNLDDWLPLSEVPAVVDNAGDLVYGIADNEISNLSIGTEGQVLKVASGLPAWQSEKSWQLKGSGSLDGTGFSVSGITGERIFIALHNWSHDDPTEEKMLAVRFNNDSGPNYINTGGLTAASSLRSPMFPDTSIHDITMQIDLANTGTILKPVSTIADNSSGQYFGYYRNVSPITSVQVLLSPSANFDGGSYEVWSFE